MKIIYNKNLSECTSFNIGGPCDVFVEPTSIDELIALIRFLKKNKYKYYILGAGTNVLVADSGLKGVVIHIGNDMGNIEVEGKYITAEAGARMSRIALAALENNIQGFEPLSGIPGTIGGAVCMNAGAYNKEIKDMIEEVVVLDENLEVISLKRDKCKFGYRTSLIQENGYIVLKVVIAGNEGEYDTIKSELLRYKKLRESKQPLNYPSAGSVFKRPGANMFAAKLIEDSNLKGEKIGDAQVSEKHAGFIVNVGNATAKDVQKLIKHIINNVDMYYNVKLEPEIKMWGKF